jgi:DNA-directed RNA polymerase sigma subunit (sigma70/sigma32)
MWSAGSATATSPGHSRRSAQPSSRAEAARVLELHYGLDGREPRTVQAVGQEPGLARERVRQIEMATLRGLSAQSELRELKVAA